MNMLVIVLAMVKKKGVGDFNLPHSGLGSGVRQKRAMMYCKNHDAGRNRTLVSLQHSAFF